jgi:hypothetical protein
VTLSFRSGGWTQAAGRYQVYVGDSFALADLPLRGSFTMAATPGPRQVTVSAPATVRPGQAATVRVTPPGYAPDATAVVHATATTGGWLREAGVNVTPAR